MKSRTLNLLKKAAGSRLWLASCLVVSMQVNAQTPLTTGHTDVGIAYEDSAWNLHVGRHEDSPPAEYAPNEAILEVGLASATTVPTSAAFGFLGSAGAPVYILPEAQNPALLFLGLGTEELPSGLFADDRVTLSLSAVRGPGRFWMYEVGALGAPVVFMNSADGITPGDSVVLTAGGHRHVNWAFSLPGTYQVDLEAAGTLAADNRFTTSGPVTYTFKVLPPASPCFRFTQEHVDLLSFVWDAENSLLSLMASDDAHGGTLYAGNQCVVIAPETTRFTLPAGTPLGNEGDSLWILAQNPYPDTPYVGVSAERLPAGSFEDPLTIQLTRVEGPGQFIVWQTTSFGNFDLKMDSRDGIGPGDKLTPSVGGHEHYNWGFTTSGVYRVYFQASGIRAGQATYTLSPETYFTFHVLPLSPFEIWQTNRFDCPCDPAISDRGADPDHDGIVNAMEYALNLDPNFPDRSGLPSGSIISTNGQNYGAITYTRVKAATDCVYEVIAADRVTAGEWQPLTLVHRVEDLGAVERVTMRDAVPVSGERPRFYQLRIRLP